MSVLKVSLLILATIAAGAIKIIAFPLAVLNNLFLFVAIKIGKTCGDEERQEKFQIATEKIRMM